MVFKCPGCGGAVQKRKNAYKCKECNRKMGLLGAELVLFDSSEIIDFEIKGKKYRMKDMEVNPLED